MFLNFLLVLSIGKLTKSLNFVAIFLPTYCLFQDLEMGKKIGSGCEVLYYLDNGDPSRLMAF
jgi:hypothetical protein